MNSFNGPIVASFSLFLSILNSVDSKQMFNVNFVDDWI